MHASVGHFRLYRPIDTDWISILWRNWLCSHFLKTEREHYLRFRDEQAETSSGRGKKKE